MGSNTAQGMDVSLCLFCVCIGRGLAIGRSPIQGALPTDLGLRNWSETKRFMDALCSKVGATGEREAEREREQKWVRTVVAVTVAGRVPATAIISVGLKRRNWYYKGAASTRSREPLMQWLRTDGATVYSPCHFNTPAAFILDERAPVQMTGVQIIWSSEEDKCPKL
jgi:hypothetical protein